MQVEHLLLEGGTLTESYQPLVHPVETIQTPTRLSQCQPTCTRPTFQHETDPELGLTSHGYATYQPSGNSHIAETVDSDNYNYTICLLRQQYAGMTRVDDKSSPSFLQCKDPSLLLYDSSSFNYYRTQVET